MITAELLRGIALVLGGAVAVAITVWLVHAAWATGRARRLARARPGVFAALADALGTDDRDEAVAALGRLPLEDRIGALIEMAHTVAGEQRRRLDGLAREAGVMDLVERWARRRRWSRRLRAARLISLFGDGGEGVGEALLRDRRPDVRAQAAAWAAGHPTPTRIGRLVEMLGDPQPYCRFAARGALVSSGAAAGAGLARALADAARRSASGGAATAADLAALDVARAIPDPAFLASALELTRARDPRIRAAAAHLAGAVGGPGAATALRGLVRDRAAAVRAATAAGLGHLGHWQSAGLVAELLGDPAAPVRRSAGGALARMGPTGELLLRKAARAGVGDARDVARYSLGLEPEFDPEQADAARPERAGAPA